MSFSLKSLLKSRDAMITEFLGVFLIVVTISFTRIRMDDLFAQGAVTFLVYSLTTYAAFKFSKAHLNPAVSIGQYSIGNSKLSTLVYYLVSQILASFAAAFVCQIFNGSGFLVGNEAPWP